MGNLLIETRLFEGKVNEDESGRTIVKGILQRAGAENQNGRIYPMEILQREAKKYETLIKERRALGELDHPDSSVINLKNVSHNVREIHWDGDDLVGTVEILPTPSGNILKELLRAGILLGISSRGMGSVTPMRGADNGKVQVGEDFELIGWDFVSNPSTHGAFLSPKNEGTLNESITNKNNTYKYTKANNLMRDIMCEVGGYCECDFGVE